MTPLCLTGADLAVIRILALLRKYKNQHTHIFYTEDISEVQELPRGEFFSDLQLKKPTYYVGAVDDTGSYLGNWANVYIQPVKYSSHIYQGEDLAAYRLKPFRVVQQL